MSDGDTENPQESGDHWTDFETDDGPCGTESVDGNPVWGAYCPQDGCGERNLFEGDPSGFVNRPYRCNSCGWVSLMHESAAELDVVE